MDVVRPLKDSILQLQSKDDRYYFSNAAGAIFRKNGLLFCRHPDANLTPKIVLRGCDPATARIHDEMPVLLEGPVDPDLLDAYGIASRCHHADILHVSDQTGLLSSFSYSTFKVRRIPKRKSRVLGRLQMGDKDPGAHEPFLFISPDSKWNVNDFQFQTFNLPDGWESLLTIEIDGKREPVAIRKGAKVVLGLPLIDMLVYEHAFAPLDDAGYYQMVPQEGNVRDAWETWLMSQVDSISSNPGITRVDIQAWPTGHDSCFTVRHDLDRDIGTTERDRILNLYEEHGVYSTWFLLNRTTDRSFAMALADSGHELALHVEAEDRDGFIEQYNFLDKLVDPPILGYTAHGGQGSQGYLGQKQHEWADELNMTYVEILGRDNKLPHAAILLEEGVPKATDHLMVPVLHHSLDSGMKPEAHNLEQAVSALSDDLSNGDHAVLMNHPDIHVDELETAINTLNFEGTWRATMAEVANWTRTSHYKSNVKWHHGDSVQLTFDERLSNPGTIRITTDGSTQVHHVPKGTTEALIHPSGDCRIETTKNRIEDYFKDISTILMKDQVAKGRPREAIRGSVITNCDRLSSRADAILRMCPLQPGEDVAELGCGFGFLAVALNLESGASVDGFDIDTGYLDFGQSFLAKHPELADKVCFDKLDYLQDPLPEERYDVAILNNTLLYILGRGNQHKAMLNVFRSLKPGGRVFVYHANLWCPREPFTKLPFVHWMPRKLGTYITTILGKRSMMDLHFISPAGMKSILKNVGCRNIQYWPEAKQARKTKIHRRLFCRFYGMTGTRPRESQ